MRIAATSSFTSSSTTCEPMRPAPPITSSFFPRMSMARPPRAARPTRRARRAPGPRARAEQLVVALADLDAPLEFRREAAELGQHHGALEGVHAAADADARVLVATALAAVSYTHLR